LLKLAPLTKCKPRWHPRPEWTEADRRALLTKVQCGDAQAKVWLGAAYEQGWFGKANFQEARESKMSHAQVSEGDRLRYGGTVIRNHDALCL